MRFSGRLRLDFSSWRPLVMTPKQQTGCIKRQLKRRSGRSRTRPIEESFIFFWLWANWQRISCNTKHLCFANSPVSLRLLPPNHRLLPPNHRLPPPNHRLLPPNKSQAGESCGLYGRKQSLCATSSPPHALFACDYKLKVSESLLKHHLYQKYGKIKPGNLL